jgi:hypothetical protein
MGAVIDFRGGRWVDHGRGCAVWAWVGHERGEGERNANVFSQRPGRSAELEGGERKRLARCPVEKTRLVSGRRVTGDSGEGHCGHCVDER